MKDFFQVFTRLGGFLLFLILEVLCFVLIIQYNQKQKDIYFNTVGLVSSTMDEGVTATSNYLSLSQQNDSLHCVNSQLNTKLRNLEAQLERLNIPDSVLQLMQNPELDFTYLPAKIISKSFTGLHNSMILNRGITDSITQRMGVVGDQGVIGVVTAVSKHHARVMPILHRQSRISASIKRNGYFGSLVWPGGDVQKMQLEALPKHADVQVGDTIQTSGFSNIFPEGIVIGTITKAELAAGDNYYTVEVALINDLSRQKFAYIILDGRRGDLVTIEQE